MRNGRFIAVLCFVLSTATASAAISGDPTAISGNSAPAICGPWHPDLLMGTRPYMVTRDSFGRTSLTVCYFKTDPCPGHAEMCPVCPEFPTVTAVTLREWCQQLEALPVPPVTGPGQLEAGVGCAGMFPVPACYE